MFDVKNITKDYSGHHKPFEKIERVKYPKEFRQKATGDRAHLIKVGCIKENKNIRFTKRVKNGSEITFFYKLSRNADPLLINKTVKIIEYQLHGLSDVIRKEFDYFKHAKIFALNILDAPSSYYFYSVFIKHIAKPLKQPYGKRIRSLLKKLLGKRYYDIKSFLKSEGRK